ncbi:MAG: hypothetical protein PHW10_03705 [Candidatus Peribacteraceae bacterium]|nr:hypothetical protein [Candidatus Peribacteraceae bacterium]
MVCSLMVAGGAFYHEHRPESITHFSVGDIVIEDGGGMSSIPSGTEESWFAVKGCSLEHARQAFRDAKFPLAEQDSTPWAVNLSGKHPFRSLRITARGVVDVELDARGSVSAQQLHDLARRLYWGR